MKRTLKAKHIGVTISAAFSSAYKYLSDPGNFPEWASGLCKSITRLSGNEWMVDSPMGKVKVKFTESNPFGIIDHYVELEPGKIVYNPMRILENEEGCEIVFTLFQTMGMSEEKFKEDEAWVRKDLEELKNLLEKKFSD
ncbi:SRPBCC family protein [Leptospira wolffii]|uniref:SRPBCC family protein n=1 Tax=Leptospira wolffii TaxID=409998 RepID=UPI001082F802|nr:SRPBCC family protein [Leptospira wolffii]TGL47482.1 SRPBCC family protein [Leptospira wolffii]